MLGDTFGNVVLTKLARDPLRDDAARTGGDVGCSCQQQTTKPVNTRTGTYWTTATDLHVDSPGPDLTWSRLYASQAITDTTTANGLSPGWQHHYAARVITPGMPGGEPNTIIIVTERANRVRFADRGNGIFLPSVGVYSTLTQSGSTYLWTARDQTQYTFNSTSGRLTSIRDPQGRLVNLVYNATTPSQLDQIVDANDGTRKLILTYTTGRISTVSDGTRSVTYGYGTSGDLSTVTDVRTQPTTYAYYTTSHLLKSITNALGQQLELVDYSAYTAQGKVTTQSLLDGQQLQFQYSPTATTMTTTGPDGKRDTRVISYAADNTMTGQTLNGQAVVGATFDAALSPGIVRDGNNNPTRTDHNGQGLPLEQTDALGRRTTMRYDTRSNLTAMTDAQGVTSRYRYDTLNNVISTTVGLTTTASIALTTLTRYQYKSSGGTWSSTESGAVDSRVYEQQAADGVITRYAYDATFPHRVTTVTLGPGTAAQQVTAYGFDTLGRQNSVTTGSGTALARTNRTVYNADNTVQQTIQNYKDGVYSAANPDEDVSTTYGYDGVGRQIWVKDALGRYDATHYDPKGRVDWTAQNLSSYSGGTTLPATPATYSASAPAANVALFYGYDGLGRTAFVTQTGILTGTFNASTLQFASATRRVTRTEYDALSRPVTVTLNYRPGELPSADRNLQTITNYDGAGNAIWQRDALGRWTKTEYDALNRPVKTIANYQDGNPLTGNADADLVTFTSYDQAGRVAQTVENYVDGVFTATEPITDRVTLPEYDPLGRVTATIQNRDSTQTTRTDTNRRSETAFDATTGRTLGQRDPLGRWVSMQYDALGRVSATVQNCRTSANVAVNSGCATFAGATPDRNVTSQTRYDALGRVYETVDPLGYVTHTTFDGLGRTTATTQNYVSGGAIDAATNVTTSSSYDVLGRTTGQTDATNALTRQGYNALGQTVVMTDSLSRVTTMGSDGSGGQRWTRLPDGRVSVNQVDGLGRTVASIQNYQDGVVAAGEPVDRDLISRTSYDAAGRRSSSTDSVGRVTAFAYDNRDLLTTVTENLAAGACALAPCNVQTRYGYDRVGNRTTITDARGLVTRRMAYDAANEVVDATDGLGQHTTSTYDVGGRQTAQGDPRGSAYNLTYSYDNLDRPIGMSAQSSTNLSPIGMTYNARGDRLAVSDGGNSTSFTPDPLGRITQLTAPNTGTVLYGYNARGQRTRLTYPDSTVIDYTYLNDGQLDLVKQGATTLADYNYEALTGRVQQVVRANGATTTYGYDQADRLNDVRTQVGGADTSRFQYQTDRLGLRTRVDETLAQPSGATATPTPTSGTATPTPTQTASPTPAGATRLRTATFEQPSLTDPSTGFSSTAGTVSRETTSPINGTASFRVPNATSGTGKFSLSDTSELFVTFYLRLPSIPTGTARIVQVVDNNGGSSLTAGNLDFSSGKLRLRTGTTTTIGTTASALLANTTYRIGLHQKQGTGTNAVLEAYIAVGNAAFTTPFAQSSTQSITTPIKEVVVGATNSTTVDALFDDIALDTAAFAPPAGGTVPTSTPTATSTNTPTATPAGPTATPTSMPSPTAIPTATPPSGTRLRLLTFENTSLTDATTGFSSTTGTVSRDTSAPLKGTASFRVPNNSTGNGKVTLSSPSELFVAFYLRLASVPTGPARILNISNTDGTTGNLDFSSGKLRLRTGTTTTIGTTASALQANTTYHIAIHQKSGTGSNAVLEAFIVDTTGGDTAFGAAFAQTSTGNSTTAVVSVQVGATNSRVMSKSIVYFLN